MKELWGNSVQVTDGELARKREANRAYLMRLDRDKLLLNYRMEAGLYTAPYLPADIHGGWESPTCQLRGHFAGHWLSAAALHYHATGDTEIKARADYMVAQLALCQAENGGEWVAAVPEKYLDWIARGKQVWAPQYGIHKTFMGLVDMAQYAGNQQALQVAENFARWFLRWARQFDREQFDDILDFETGGMLEIWVQLYELTQKKEYLELMDKYYRGRLFDALLKGQDVLTNMHANTTIPEVLGCARAYDATGDEKWRNIVQAYWDLAVTERGTYATGGQTNGEIWTPKNEMAARLGQKNQEFCTVYNMMRLAGFLFRWTGNASYADYCEKNLYNGIMAQSYWEGRGTNGYHEDTPNTGLLTYFLPLKPGGYKGWASETEDFFCCHGTAVQANAQLERGMYYQDEGGLYVCQYFNSQITFTHQNQKLQLQQMRDNLAGSFHFGSTSSARQGFDDTTSRVPHNPDVHAACFIVNAQQPVSMALRLRIPPWAQGWRLLLNGAPVQADVAENGFAVLDRTWNSGDMVRLEMPKRITTVPIPDEPNKLAFLYGPVLLAGLCDEERCLTLGAGQKPEALLVHDNEREWGSWKSSFRVTGQERGLAFLPLHEIGYQKYTVYFPMEGKK